MKRILVLTSIVLLFAVSSFASPHRSVINMKNTSKTTDIAVASTATAYTNALNAKDIKNDQDLGVLYKATSSGAVDLSLTLETSYRLPATEGAGSSNYLGTSVVDASITDEIWHLATIDTVMLPFIRFRVIGQGSNDASTTIEIKVSK